MVLWTSELKRQGILRGSTRSGGHCAILFLIKKNIYLHRPPLRACVCVFKFRSNNGPGSATQSNWKGCDPSGIGQWRSIYTNYRDTLKVGKVNRTCFNFYSVTKMRKLNDIQVYSF
jgi:hypothetical protein